MQRLLEKPENVSDETLAYQFKTTGDNKAFSLLVGRHKDAIFRKCKGYVKDEDAAKDICQEILIKLYLKIQSYQSQSKFSTWLFSIIHNTSIDYLRKNKRSAEKVLIEKLKDSLADLVENEDEIPAQLSIQILEDLLSQLSPQDRMLLVMKYREEHPIKDIQQATGLSESAIKMRLKRARERINQLYNKHKPD